MSLTPANATSWRLLAALGEGEEERKHRVLSAFLAIVGFLDKAPICFRNPMLYPAELRARVIFIGFFG